MKERTNRMCIKDEREKWRKYPRILEAMEKKGYFDMTPEERIQKGLKVNRKLNNSNNVLFTFIC